MLLNLVPHVADQLMGGALDQSARHGLQQAAEAFRVSEERARAASKRLREIRPQRLRELEQAAVALQAPIDEKLVVDFSSYFFSVLGRRGIIDEAMMSARA
jgi:hypothetical protein